MKVETRLFGEVEVSGETVVTFPAGLPGFEAQRSFVVLQVPGTEGQLEWLQSLEDPALGLPLLDPARYFPSYVPVLEEGELEALGLAALTDGVIRVVVTIPQDVQQMTANLRAPLLFNPHTRLGRQVILQDDSLGIKQPVIVQRAG